MAGNSSQFVSVVVFSTTQNARLTQVDRALRPITNSSGFMRPLGLTCPPKPADTGDRGLWENAQ